MWEITRTAIWPSLTLPDLVLTSGGSSKLTQLERRRTCMFFLVSSPCPCHLWCSQMRWNCRIDNPSLRIVKKSGPILGPPPLPSSSLLLYSHPSLLNKNISGVLFEFNIHWGKLQVVFEDRRSDNHAPDVPFLYPFPPLRGSQMKKKEVKTKN